MKTTSYTIWTLIIAGLLPPFLIVTFYGIQTQGSAIFGFYYMLLFAAYLCAGIPSLLLFLILHRYGKRLLHQSPPLQGTSEWLPRTVLVATLSSLLFPVSWVVITAYLSRGVSPSEAFIAVKTWLIPSLATGVTVGLLLGIIWKRMAERHNQIDNPDAGEGR